MLIWLIIVISEVISITENVFQPFSVIACFAQSHFNRHGVCLAKMCMGISPMPPASKNKCELVKVLVHRNVYWPEFLTKCPFGPVAK